MAITTPDAVPGEVIEAAWGDAVRADLLAHDAAIAQRVRLDQTATQVLIGSLQATAFFATTTQNANASAMTRKDYVDAADTALTNSKVAKAGDLMSGLLTVRGDPRTAHGVEIGLGPVTASCTGGGGHATTTPNLTCGRGGAAANAGGVFVSFRANSGSSSDPLGNYLGGITVNVANSSVTYGTSSDKRLKRLTRMIDADEALAKVMLTEPVGYTWVAAPEIGEQSGFFAQDLQPIAPEAVTPGTGEPGDDDFIPWQVDLTALVPTVVAAVQALTRRVELLEGAAA